MSESDFALLKSVSGPQWSPDGKNIACVISGIDLENNRGQSEIVLISASDGEMNHLVPGWSPRFSPDGKALAFIGSEGEQSGIWLYDLVKGSKRFLTPVHHTAHFLGHRADKNFAWSPDGRWIAFVGAEPPTEPAPDSDVHVIDRVLYKTRGGRTRPTLSDNRRIHIWLVPVEGGEARRLSPGPYDEHSISWSPDGKQIAFISNRSDDPDNNYRDDLWLIDVSTGMSKQLTNTMGAEFHPRWSPDGRFIAYLAMSRELNSKDNPAENTRLYILPAAGGERQALTEQDEHVLSVSWHPDSEHLYFTSRTEGTHPLSRVAIQTGEVDPIISGRLQAFEFDLDVTGHSLSYTQIDMTHPIELWMASNTGGNPEQVTHINESYCRHIAIQGADMFWFESFDQTRVQGWLLEPIGLNPRKKYPLILHLHGGPHNMWGYRFDEGFQLLSSQGYAVLLINHRGSRGYGQAFSDACIADWGGDDYMDLMAGMDYVLAHYEWVDKDRLGVTGVSYGGYMTNWIITQTDRFKAAVPVSSLSNLVSFYGTSVYQLLMEVEFQGYPWDNYDLYWKWSPMKYVHHVTTPTLIVHGEDDQEVAIEQAEQMFIALKKNRVETVFVRYPGEGHGWAPSWTPQHKLDFNQRVLDWFNTYVKQAD